MQNYRHTRKYGSTYDAGWRWRWQERITVARFVFTSLNFLSNELNSRLSQSIKQGDYKKINSPGLRPPPPLATSLARSPSWVFTRNWKSTHTHVHARNWHCAATAARGATRGCRKKPTSLDRWSVMWRSADWYATSLPAYVSRQMALHFDKFHFSCAYCAPSLRY